MISDDAPANGPRLVNGRSIDEYRTASAAVVDAIADAEGVDPPSLPTERDICLFEHVDPDALDSIVADQPSGSELSVAFSIGDYRVRIAKRRVEVYGGDSPAE